MRVATPIEPRFVERLWGSRDLEPWFPAPQALIGEVWFDAGPLLIKFLFTSQALSVQVHPEDGYARLHENSAGKTEMWHILRAVGRARLAAGFARHVTPLEVRQAACGGSIEALLQWRHPEPGDTFLLPAGTVHALGPGLAVCEIQQNSDVTYRLYDYNRGRQLHLERALEVAHLAPHPGKSAPEPLAGGGCLLARCAYFATEKCAFGEPTRLRPGWIIVLAGTGRLGQETVRPGQVWKLEDEARVAPDGEVTLLRTYVPQP